MTHDPFQVAATLLRELNTICPGGEDFDWSVRVHGLDENTAIEIVLTWRYGAYIDYPSHPGTLLDLAKYWLLAKAYNFEVFVSHLRRMARFKEEKVKQRILATADRVEAAFFPKTEPNIERRSLKLSHHQPIREI